MHGMSFYNPNRLHKDRFLLINVFQKDEHCEFFRALRLRISNKGASMFVRQE